jgi:CBS domain-containing protein
MQAITENIRTLTAGDLMKRSLVVLRETMPLGDAVRLLLHNQIGGAPVTDKDGRCVGMFTAFDIFRLLGNRTGARRSTDQGETKPCPFQANHRTFDGRDLAICTLPPGACPVQETQEAAGAESLIVCGQPGCILSDMLVGDLAGLPTEELKRYITRGPLSVKSQTPLPDLARIMLDAHIHRLIVVDDEKKPVGIVSSSDLLAVLANGELEAGANGPGHYQSVQSLAYEKWRAKGSPSGSALQDWLEAEKELDEGPYGE